MLESHVTCHMSHVTWCPEVCVRHSANSDMVIYPGGHYHLGMATHLEILLPTKLNIRLFMIG